MRTRILSFCICQSTLVSNEFNLSNVSNVTLVKHAYFLLCFLSCIYTLLVLYFPAPPPKKNPEQPNMRFSLHAVISCCAFATVMLLPVVRGAPVESSSSLKQRWATVSTLRWKLVVTSTTLGRRENTWILQIHREFTWSKCEILTVLTSFLYCS